MTFHIIYLVTIINCFEIYQQNLLGVYLFLDLNLKTLCNTSIAITSTEVQVWRYYWWYLLIHIPNTFSRTRLFLERWELNRISLSVKFFLLLGFMHYWVKEKVSQATENIGIFVPLVKLHLFLLSIGSCRVGGRPNILKHIIIHMAYLLFLPQHTKPNNESQQMPILYKPWVIVVFWSTYFQANNFNMFPICCIKHFGNCHLSSAHSVKLFYSSSLLAFSYTLGLSCCKFLFKQAL